MKFEIGGKNGSNVYDSLDEGVPLAERFLALTVYHMITGKPTGVKAEDLGATDAELEEMMESTDFDDEEVSRILNGLPKPIQ